MTSAESTPLFQYYFRALICFAAAGTLAADINWEKINLLQPMFIVLLLSYTYLAFLLTRRIDQAYAHTLAKALAWIDAGLIGASLSLVDFSLLPCVLFLTMIQFNALLNGGLRKWGEDNAAFLLGILLSMLVYQPQWVLSGRLEISAASLIGVITYFCAYALFTHARMNKLNMESQRLEQEQQLHKMRTYKLSRYLPPPVWKAINEGRDKSLLTERKRLTVFFSDIKDFSELAEEMEAEALTDLLNTYLTEMTKIVHHYGGTIDKFMGDGIMVLFGDSNSKGVKMDAIRCVTMALAMKKRMKTLQQHWHHQGIKRPLQIRMGINTGYCTVGTFGTANHLDYTALGAHVNLASRLESAAEPGEILISHETWGMVKDTIMCRDKGNVLVKGFSHPIQVYQVADLRKNLGANQSYFEKNLDGFTMYLDMEKIRNYDKEDVLQALAEVSERLRDKIIP